MKLDRNITTPRRGKYALLKLRVVEDIASQIRERTLSVHQAIHNLNDNGCLDFGCTADTDFFVIRLRDKYAAAGLQAYADAAREDDPEYASEIDTLAAAARSHPNRCRPS